MASATPDEPDIPSSVQFLEDAFWALNSGRSSSGFSLNPVSWLELEAWQRGTGNFLSAAEAEIVMRLFGVYDASVEENRPKPEDANDGRS